MPDLKRKVGPLPLWGWVLVAGGGIGLVLLVRKRKTAATEPPPVPTNVGGQTPFPGVEGSGAAGAASPEAKTPPEMPLAPPVATSPAYEQGGFAGEVRDVQAGQAALESLGLVVPARSVSSSAAPAAAADRHAANGGNPRAGLPFKAASYKGHPAHEYGHGVPGGVGPGGRFILLPTGRKTHAARPSHHPAAVKSHTPAHHTPAHPSHPTSGPHPASAAHPAAPAPHPAAAHPPAHHPAPPPPHKPAHKPPPKPRRR